MRLFSLCLLVTQPQQILHCLKASDRISLQSMSWWSYQCNSCCRHRNVQTRGFKVFPTEKVKLKAQNKYTMYALYFSHHNVIMIHIFYTRHLSLCDFWPLLTVCQSQIGLDLYRNKSRPWPTETSIVLFFYCPRQGGFSINLVDTAESRQVDQSLMVCSHWMHCELHTESVQRCEQTFFPQQWPFSIRLKTFSTNVCKQKKMPNSDTANKWSNCSNSMYSSRVEATDSSGEWYNKKVLSRTVFCSKD